MLKNKVTINLHALIIFNNLQQVSSFYEDSVVLSLLSVALKKYNSWIEAVLASK